MQILMHEVALTDTVDPLAGSYFIETTTNQMEQKIREIMARVDAQGGIVHSVSEGLVQAEVNRQAYEQERRLQAGDTKKIGVNCFREEEEEREVEFHPYREDEAQAQIGRLERVRRERDDVVVEALLGKVRAAAAGRENVMPAVMNAVEAYATVGEVCGVLKEVFGTYREPVRF